MPPTPYSDDLSLCFLLFYDTNALEPQNGDFGHQLWGGRIPILHWTSNKKATFGDPKDEAHIDAIVNDVPATARHLDEVPGLVH